MALLQLRIDPLDRDRLARVLCWLQRIDPSLTLESFAVDAILERVKKLEEQHPKEIAAYKPKIRRGRPPKHG
jgi:hypothetical protein